MSSPITYSWLKAAEGKDTVVAVASGAVHLLQAIGEPTEKFEQAKQGGTLVEVVVDSLNRLVARGSSSSNAGAQDDAEVARFMLDEIVRAAGRKMEVG